jgi:hypothetical protein
MPNVKDGRPPVNVIEAEVYNLARAHTVGGQELEDGVVPPPQYQHAHSDQGVTHG